MNIIQWEKHTNEYNIIIVLWWIFNLNKFNVIEANSFKSVYKLKSNRYWCCQMYYHVTQYNMYMWVFNVQTSRYSVHNDIENIVLQWQ